MTRRSVTKPDVLIDGQYWLSSILPARGRWHRLRHSTRLNGDWQIKFDIVAPRDWRHPALRFGALVDLRLGPSNVAVGTMDEPDWDSMTMTVAGASRDGDDALGLSAFGTGQATTIPNEALNDAILRGVLPWTRVDDFGWDPVGEDGDSAGLVDVTSILSAWAEENGTNWRINQQRQVVIHPTARTTPKWYVLPGSGQLGSAADDRADRVVVRYISDSTGKLANAWFPASTPPSGIEGPKDITDRGKMSFARAQAVAESLWNELHGESGWTNGLNLKHGQVVTRGGNVADLAWIRGGDTMRQLGVPDPRSVEQHTDFVIGQTDYQWDPDEIQVNPVGTAARTEDAVLDQVSELAADAKAASGVRSGVAIDTGPLVPANGAYSGSLRAIKVGRLVTLFGQLDRDGSFNSSLHGVGITLPDGMRPVSGIHQASPYFNSTDNYRWVIGTDGVIQIQESAASSQFVSINVSWAVD